MNYKQILYLVLTFFTSVSGYFFLRYAYKVTDTTPFTQEIVIIFLGTVATIFITALLLNKQTSVEINKEQSIKFLDIKVQTYEKLFDILEEMSLVENFNDENLINLQFITHRLAIIASPDVLNEYKGFLNVIQKISEDNSFSGDSRLLHKALGSLTVKVRQDLTDPLSNSNYTLAEISKIIEDNSNKSATFINDK